MYLKVTAYGKMYRLELNDFLIVYNNNYYNIDIRWLG